MVSAKIKGIPVQHVRQALQVVFVLKSQRSQRLCECFWHYFVAINSKVFWKRQQVSIVFQECHSWSTKHDIPLKVPQALPTKMGVIQKFPSDLRGITVYPRRDPRFSGTFGSGKAETIGNTLTVAGCIFDQVLPWPLVKRVWLCRFRMRRHLKHPETLFACMILYVIINLEAKRRQCTRQDCR